MSVPTEAFVINGNGVDFCPVEDSEVVVVPAAQADYLIGEALSGDTYPLVEAAIGSPVSIKTLLDDRLVFRQVVEAAVAALDSEGGASSMAQLAVAVRDAGFGDFTEPYADEIAFLNDEGQTGE